MSKNNDNDESYVDNELDNVQTDQNDNNPLEEILFPSTGEKISLFLPLEFSH